jgi:hypothetical protein
MSKKSASRGHFKRRMNERFGIVLTTAQCKDIVDLIQNGKTKCIKQQSLRTTIHEVKINGILIHVVYDKIRKTPVTALPPKGLKGLNNDNNYI